MPLGAARVVMTRRAAAAGASAPSVLASGLVYIDSANGNTASISASITVPSGTTCLIIHAGIQPNSTVETPLSSYAFNSVAMTSLIPLHADAEAVKPASQWLGLLNPDIGAFNFTASRVSGTASIRIHWIALEGDIHADIIEAINNPAPVDPHTWSGGISSTPTTVSANALVLSGAVIQGAGDTFTSSTSTILLQGDSGAGTASSDVGVATGWHVGPSTPGSSVSTYSTATSEGGQVSSLVIKPA